MITAETLARPWRERNVAIEVAIRECLGRSSGKCSSYFLAASICVASEPATVAKVAQILSRIAPHMPATIATHDGEEIRRYGKTWRRWQWHGQNVSK